MLTYERVTLCNLKCFLKLTISEDQKRIMHTSNAKTFFQSVIWVGYSKLFLIRKDGQPAGYIFLYCHRKTHKYNLGRLLIDKKFQGRGIGKQAVQWSLDYLYGEGAPSVLLSVHPENAAAKKLYEGAGFQYCEGRYWGDEMVMEHRPQ